MELTPGANMGYLAALSLVGGRRGGVMAAARVATAFAIALAVALIAATELEPHIDVGSQILQAIGSLYFLWLAVDTWRAGNRALNRRTRRTCCSHAPSCAACSPIW